MNHRMISTTVAIALLTVASHVLAAAEPAWLDALDAYLSEQVVASGLAAASVAVVSEDEMLYARGFGETTVGSGVPVGPGTSFEIGSLTKSMTALAVLRLHEAGTVEIDAPVRTYLPWFRVADEEASRTITLRQLLSHSSGLPTTSHAVVWHDFERIDPSVEQGVRALGGVRLATEPGEAFQYANMGYVTLGAVIEAVTGEPWWRHVETTLFEPLGMQASAASVQGREGLEIAQAYAWRLGRRAPVQASSPFAAPAGSLNVSSARDMGAYLQAWLSPSEGGLVTPATVDVAFRGHVPLGNGEDVGLGWIVADRHGERLVHHTGGTVGATSYMALLPERGLGLVVLANSMSAPAPAIGRGALDVLLGRSPAPVGPDVGRWASYVLTGIAAAGLLLLVLLAARAVKRLRGDGARHRRWVHVVRTLAVGTVAGALWIVVPSLLNDAGVPAPFGIRGYPFDVLVATVALLGVPTSWSAYFLASWVASSRARREEGRRSGAIPAVG